MSRHWIWLRIGHIALDVVGIYGAFLLAYFVRVGFLFSSDFPFSVFASLSVISTVAWSIFLMLVKYYRLPPRHGERAWFDVLLIFLGGAVAIGLLIVTYFFPREILFSRLLGVYAFVFASAWLLLTHSIFRQILASQKKKEKDVYRTLIVGANRVSEKIIQAIKTNKFAPYKIIGVIDPYGLAKKVKGAQLLGKLNKLESVCEREKITALIQCDGFEHTLNLISFCEEKNIKFQFDPALRGIFEENLRIRDVAGVTMISFVKRDFNDKRRYVYKGIDWILEQVFDVD